MIYTVTLNPSLDYMVRVAGFMTGRMNRTGSEEVYAGGKGINVSAVLKVLGVDSIALGFVAGFTGSEIIAKLDALEISSDFIRLNDGMSRINVKLQSEFDDMTEINGQGPVIEKKHFKQLLDKLECMHDGDMLVLSGSVPAGMEDRDHVYASICSLVKSKKIRIVVDAEGDLLRNTLSFQPFLIKPNCFELASLFHINNMTEESIIYFAQMLQSEGALNVLVSMGEKGALLLDEFGRIIRQPAVKGTVVSAVGAGDSMVAGFLAGLTKPYHKKDGNGLVEQLTTEDYQNALKLGIIAGCSTAFSHGLPNAETINSIAKKIGYH